MTTFRWLPLTLALIATPLAAQDKGVPLKPVESKPAEMAEDVEILRLLLNKSVGLDLYLDWGRTPSGADDITTAYTAIDVTPPATAALRRTYILPLTYPQFDGVYLNRHGVAFTVRLGAGLLLLFASVVEVTFPLLS